MVTRILSRSILNTKECLSSVFSRSYASFSIKSSPSALASLLAFSSLRLRPRPLVSAAAAANFRHLSPAVATIRGFATRQTTSLLNDSNPNWSNRPPKETILLDGASVTGDVPDKHGFLLANLISKGTLYLLSGQTTGSDDDSRLTMKNANKIGKINLAATGKDLIDDEKQGDVIVDLFTALDMETEAVDERTSELENS